MAAGRIVRSSGNLRPKDQSYPVARLTEQQGISTAVNPGDLPVWDGHVAMVAGNNLMIEAVHACASKPSGSLIG